jgi:hypothetical protein
MNKPTDEQQGKLLGYCGFEFIESEYEYDTWVRGSDDFTPEIDDLDLNFLFECVVPEALSKLESRFDMRTNLIRGLELLFKDWLNFIRQGFSYEDALFCACYKAFGLEE